MDQITAPITLLPVVITAPLSIGGTGPAGAAGKTILSGTGAPSNGTGANGDFYLATNTSTIYGPKAAGVWPAGVSLVGPAGPAGANGAAGADGADGAQGPPGADGADGAPGADGADGAQGPAGADGADGADGAQGPAGADGADGADGVDGKTILSGTGAPSNGLGSNGDFYLATDSSTIYGPKAAGVWPAGVSLVGPPGADGADGATGPAGPGATPGGSTTQVQLNNAGAFGGVSGLTANLTTGALTQTQTALGTTPTSGFEFTNTTAAAAGAQQVSPSTTWTGQGWKTTATAASQTVQFRAYTLPVQGTSSPTATWVLQSSINGGLWTNRATLTSAGVFEAADFRGDTFTGTSTHAVLKSTGNTASSGVGLSSLNVLGWGSGTFGTGNTHTSGDTFLSRAAAANIRQGLVDVAAPVAQTSSVQGVLAGTPNAAGANRTFSGSQGTGTGVGGEHIFTVATAGGAGSSQNALVEAFRIKQDRSVCISNVSAAPATPTGGGILYVEAGALKYIGSSGTVTTIANA